MIYRLSVTTLRPLDPLTGSSKGSEVEKFLVKSG